MRLTKLLILAALTVMLPVATQAASSLQRAEIEQIAGNCVGSWESEYCLRSVSNSNMALIAEYAATLQQAGQRGPVQTLKEYCAASTAGRLESAPAYAFRSAFTQCANTMSNIYDQTQIKPDPNRFQVLIGSVWCLGKDKNCASIEGGLKPFIKQ